MLTLSQIRKAFGSTVAVDGLSLSVEPGEVFGLLGPNGAGKTTTISMAVGLLRPDSGSVQLRGLGSPREPQVRRHLGVAPQSLALYDELTGEENLLFFGRLFGLAKSALQSRAAAVLNDVGLTPKARELVAGYSGGMKRRLNLAVALIHDPPLLLLDEPTAGVDPQSRNNIIELVARLKAAGRTIIYTTHYLEEAQRVCDRVGIIDRGRLLALGTPDQLVSQHGGHSTLSVVTADGERQIATDDPLRELQVMLATHTLSEVRIQRPSLESVFLNLTGRSLRD